MWIFNFIYKFFRHTPDYNYQMDCTQYNGEYKTSQQEWENKNQTQKSKILFFSSWGKNI